MRVYFLRLRGILGKRTGFEGKSAPQFQEILKNVDTKIKKEQNLNFDEVAQKDFLKGAKIAYETIITDFSDDDNKLVKSKPLLSQKIQEQFNQALKKEVIKVILLKLLSLVLIQQILKNIKKQIIYFK